MKKKESQVLPMVMDALGMDRFDAALLCVATSTLCRLLVFSFSPQLLALPVANCGQGAATIFVVDNTNSAQPLRTPTHCGRTRIP